MKHILKKNTHLSMSNDSGITSNMLIKGNCIDAMQQAMDSIRGKVKCIYADPPYNTGNKFAHYEDRASKSAWASMMRQVLDLSREALSDDGVVWLSIDDNEVHHLRVLCDEVFGSKNFAAMIVVELNPKGRNLAKFFATNHEYLVCYAKDRDSARLVPGVGGELDIQSYANIDSGGRYRILRLALTSSRQGVSPTMVFPVYFDPNTGKITFDKEDHLVEIWPTLHNGDLSAWRWSRSKMESHMDEILVGVPKGRETYVLYAKDYFREDKVKKYKTIWLSSEIGSTDEAAVGLTREGFIAFSTPKPERLLRRILECSTSEGDLVLDPFLGSGTTAVVAHKMKRRWVGIEMGEQAETICKPRIDKVIEGDGGVSSLMGWDADGGYEFFDLIPDSGEELAHVNV